jgi:hypothetical protein
MSKATPRKSVHSIAKVGQVVYAPSKADTIRCFTTKAGTIRALGLGVSIYGGIG